MSTLVWIFHTCFLTYFGFPINIITPNFLLSFACVECSLRLLEIFYFDHFFARKISRKFYKKIFEAKISPRRIINRLVKIIIIGADETKQKFSNYTFPTFKLLLTVQSNYF